MKQTLKKEIKDIKEKLERYQAKKNDSKVKKYSKKLKEKKQLLKALKNEIKEKVVEISNQEVVSSPEEQRNQLGEITEERNGIIYVVSNDTGQPTTTKQGHQLQSLAPLPEKTISNQSNITLLLFYMYVEPEWTVKQHEEAIKWAQQSAESFGITGRLRIAREGFNATMTGQSNQIRLFCRAMRDWKPELFAHVDFKLTDDLPVGQAFPALKVFPVTELVNYGLGKLLDLNHRPKISTNRIGNQKQPSLTNGGIHLNAQEYHQKMQENNTVIIDVRNTYEAAIGRFDPPKGIFITYFECFVCWY